MLIDVEDMNNNEKAVTAASSSLNDSSPMQQNRRPINVGDMNNDEKVKAPSSSTSMQSNGRLPSPLPRLRSNSINRYQTDNFPSGIDTLVTSNRYEQSQPTPTTYKSHLHNSSTVYHTAKSNGESALATIDIPIKPLEFTDTRTSASKNGCISNNVQRQPTPSKSFRKTVPLPSFINDDDHNTFANTDDLNSRRNFAMNNDSAKIDHYESVRNNGININQSLSTPRLNYNNIHIGNNDQDPDHTYQSRSKMDNKSNQDSSKFSQNISKSVDYTKNIDTLYPERNSRSYKAFSTCSTPESQISLKANPDIRIPGYLDSTNNSQDFELQSNPFVPPESLLLIEL